MNQDTSDSNDSGNLKVNSKKSILQLDDAC